MKKISKLLPLLAVTFSHASYINSDQNTTKTVKETGIYNYNANIPEDISFLYDDINSFISVVSKITAVSIINSWDINQKISADFKKGTPSYVVIDFLMAALDDYGYTLKVLNGGYIVDKQDLITTTIQFDSNTYTKSVNILINRAKKFDDITVTPDNVNLNVSITGYKKSIKKILVNFENYSTYKVNINAKLVSISKYDVETIGAKYKIQLNENDSLYSLINVLSDKATDIGLDGLSSLPLHSQHLAIVDFLEKNNFIHVISKPTISTLSGSEASMEIGDYNYVKNIIDLRGNLGFEKLKTGLSLNVLPIVLTNSNIHLELDIGTSFIIEYDINGNPVVNTKRIKTNTVIKNKEMLILGSFNEDSKIKVREGLPGLSEIPIIGGLFRWSSKINKNDSFFVILDVSYTKTNKI